MLASVSARVCVYIVIMRRIDGAGAALVVCPPPTTPWKASELSMDTTIATDVLSFKPICSYLSNMRTCV